jgi:transglutaminase-like putative cysteine protease
MTPGSPTGPPSDRYRKRIENLMRHGSDERIAVTSALASLLAALTLSPLVQGVTWLFVAAITVVTMMVTGIVARQLLRWWPAVAATQALVLLVTLLVLFARSRILEGPGAIDLLRQLVEAGFQVTREQAPPVEATQGIVLLVAGSTGLVALLVDLLAATLRQPALAGLPLLAVYCVPAALLNGGLPWFYFLLAASGFLLLLTADSGDRVRGWGRVLASSSRTSGPGRRPSDGGMAAGGRRVGAATVVLAVLLPALVPGLSNQIIGGNGEGDGTGSGGRTITRINPILDLRKDLANPKDTELLTYRTNVQNPEPLRIVTSDVFDGKTWAPSTDRIPRSQKAKGTLPVPPGLSDNVKTLAADTQITIGPLDETYLPLPYPARSVDVRGDWLYDANTLNVIGDGVTTANLSYKVTHLDVRPTAQQLIDAPLAPTSITSRYLALPPNMPSVIEDTARKIGGDGSPYEQAVRLQRWFRSDAFTYTLEAPDVKDGDTSTDAIVAFIDQKHGYCVHFASTMAVMARQLGIPARVAVGFLPGKLQPEGDRVISANDAHAWPELYFEGVGWTRFEPTPRGGGTPPPEWSEPPAGAFPEDPAATADPQATASAAPNSAGPSQAPNKADEPAAAPTTAPTGPGVPWKTIVVALIVLLGLASPRLAGSLASRRRWNRATSVPALAEAAWDELRLGLSDLGVQWAASWTPRAVEQRLLDDYDFEPDQTAALHRLTHEIEDARYAPPDDELGRRAEERAADIAAVIAVVAAPLPGKTRWRARLWPQSGVDTLTGLLTMANSASERAGRQATKLTGQERNRVGRGDGPGSDDSGPGGSGPGGSSPGGPGSGGPEGYGPGGSGGYGPDGSGGSGGSGGYGGPGSGDSDWDGGSSSGKQKVGTF